MPSPAPDRLPRFRRPSRSAGTAGNPGAGGADALAPDGLAPDGLAPDGAPADGGSPGCGPSQPPPSFVRDLRTVLAERDFRRLFATRLVSQTGDGLFTAGLGTYVFFNASSFPDPAAAAVAFAVLYLPYSLIGPFAGVFIDRWSRRQILAWAPLLRVVFAVLAAALVASGSLGAPLAVSALLVLGVNRFFLSALSAATPHVVPRDKLVTANSVAPTSGTIMTAVGLFGGTIVHLATGGGRAGSTVTLLCGGACYLTAGLVAMRMDRDLLGPARPEGGRSRPGLLAELGTVASGLAAGIRHIAHRRRATAVLMATAVQRFLYGILLLMSILLYRNYYYAHAGANTALSHYLILGVSSAIGYGAAAVVTPVVTRRLSMSGWVTLLLAGGGILTGVLGAGLRQAEFVLLGFVLGLVAQGITIATTTIIQEEVDDGFLGRVFSLNDMLYNGSFALGAAACAAFLPVNGRSYSMLWLAAAGYVAAAAGYWLLARQPSAPGTASPSDAAQRSSSAVARSVPSGPCSSRSSSKYE